MLRQAPTCIIKGLRRSYLGNSSNRSSKRFFSRQSFDATVDQLKTLTREPANELKLKLYALFKQANEGPCASPSPGFFDFVGQKKYEAWNSLGNMSKQDAMKEYVEIVTNLSSSSQSMSKPQPQQNASATGEQPSSIERIAFPRRRLKVSEMNPGTIALKMSEQTPGVFTVQLNRPTKSNAFNMEMWQDLRDVFAGIEADHRVKVVILTGNQKSFSSGMDLQVFAEMQQIAVLESCEGRRREALSNFIQYLQDCISAPENCCVPVRVRDICVPTPVTEELNSCVSCCFVVRLIAPSHPSNSPCVGDCCGLWPLHWRRSRPHDCD